MKDKNLIYPPELFGKQKSSWTDRDFKSAIKKFSQNAPAIPVPRLYDAYKWLKEQINKDDEEADKHFTHFIELFLRILEERGAVESEVYSEVLRDSAEYKYLEGLFHNDEPDREIKMIEAPVVRIPDEPEAKKITLKTILLKKNGPLIDIDIKEWHRLVDEHLGEFKTEESLIKNCSLVVNSIKKRSEKEPYHIEIIIVYTFERLIRYKKVSLKTKDFAMQLLNLMTDKSEIWSRLHREYLEIIKK